MPTNGDKNDPKERRIRDMLGLVKFCLETTANEDATGLSSSNIQPMDPDRRAWLQEAINSMTVDTTKQLLENLALVKETIVQLERDPDHNVAVQKTCNAIEVLTDLCEEIDYASDFAKLDGFSIFKPLIGCSHEELIVKACELIAALAQNNPICQTMAMNTRLLERLIDFVDIKDKPSHIKARSYALYAISSIIRSNQEVRTHFETSLDGLTVLLHVLDYQIDRMFDAKQQPNQESQPSSPKTSPSKGGDSKKSSVYWWRKLKIRSIFLFRTLCSESSFASEFFFKKQAIKLITSQLENPHDPEIREHLLHALAAFLTSLDSPKQIESSKLSPNLRDVVEQIHNLSLQESGDDYDMTDTRSTCKELMNLIDSFYHK